VFPPRRSPNLALLKRSFIVERARQCERERHKLPNLILTDFYDSGDVVGAARVLNGSAKPSPRRSRRWKPAERSASADPLRLADDHNKGASARHNRAMAATRYFAYGRNMGAPAMELACPGHRCLGPAELRGHRLAFTRRSVRTGSGVADIVVADGESVWGVLYELDAARLGAIDEKEGGGWAYERRVVQVIVPWAEGAEVEAFAYAVIARDAEHVPPSREYLRALVSGARERGLPADYVAALAASG
jgi:gamma-glutamylcyclotransferase